MRRSPCCCRRITSEPVVPKVGDITSPPPPLIPAGGEQVRSCRIRIRTVKSDGDTASLLPNTSSNVGCLRVWIFQNVFERYFVHREVHRRAVNPFVDIGAADLQIQEEFIELMRYEKS